MPEDWTDEELRAAVRAYVWMQEEHEAGRSFSKTDVRRDLLAGPLANRTDGSVEYRWQNVSYVLDQLGLPWLEGYRPAKNVGVNVARRIAQILDEDDHLRSRDLATADPSVFDQRVDTLLTLDLQGEPAGNRNPRRLDVSSTSYERDPAVVARAMKVASGHCELCAQPAPFTRANGVPYLEGHHVRTLAEGGPDVVGNVVALCPNCHRRCHHSGDKTDAVAELYDKVDRLER